MVVYYLTSHCCIFTEITRRRACHAIKMSTHCTTTNFYAAVIIGLRSFFSLDRLTICECRAVRRHKYGDSDYAEIYLNSHLRVFLSFSIMLARRFDGLPRFARRNTGTKHFDSLQDAHFYRNPKTVLPWLILGDLCRYSPVQLPLTHPPSCCSSCCF
jgi:hypothetical protein